MPEYARGRLTRESAEASDKQVALVSLVDDHRQWFKSVHDPGKVLGGARETPREYAFCHHAIQQRHPFLIENAHDDPRFRDNPLVTDGTVGFYYGVPLEVHHQDKRANVGTLCVIDPKPGSIGQNARDKVHVLAAEVQDLLQARLEEESGSVGSGSDKERGCGSGGSEERNKRTSSHLTSAGPNLTWKPDAHTQSNMEDRIEKKQRIHDVFVTPAVPTRQATCVGRAVLGTYGLPGPQGSGPNAYSQLPSMQAVGNLSTMVAKFQRVDRGSSLPDDSGPDASDRFISNIDGRTG